MKRLISFTLIVFLSLIAFSQSQRKVDSLRSILDSNPKDTVKIKVYKALSDLYYHKDIRLVEAYLDTAYQIATERNFKESKSFIGFNLGNVYLQKMQFRLALQYFLETLKYQEKIGNQRGQAVVYASIGSVHYRQHNLDDALDNYQKSLDLYSNFSSEKDIKNKNSIINNIANIYKDRKDYDKALKTYRKSMKSSKESDDLISLGNVCNNIGSLYLELNRYDSAEYYINKGLEARKEIDDRDGIIRSQKNLAAYYIDKEQYEKGISILKEAEKSIVFSGEVAIIIDINTLLSRAYEANGNYQKALEYHKNLTKAKDSLFNIKMARELTKQEMDFKYQKREEQLKFQQQKKELKLFITIAILTLGVIIIGLLYFLGRNRVKRIKSERRVLKLEKESLEQKIEIKNKELATNVMYLVRKNEFLNGITQKLVDLKEKLKLENQTSLQTLIYDIQHSMNKEVWKEFELRFQKVHTKFYENLNQKFPDLSPNEKKLCAFLRLNMSTKEIASILHKNEKSVAVARSRLRKKLNLTNTDIDLVSFLSSI